MLSTDSPEFGDDIIKFFLGHSSSQTTTQQAYSVGCQTNVSPVAMELVLSLCRPTTDSNKQRWAASMWSYDAWAYASHFLTLSAYNLCLNLIYMYGYLACKSLTSVYVAGPFGSEDLIYQLVHIYLVALNQKFSPDSNGVRVRVFKLLYIPCHCVHTCTCTLHPFFLHDIL